MTNAQVLAGIIEDAGYVATIEENGVAFKVEGVPYRFESYADDDRYGRLMVGFNIPDDVSLERLHSIANEQNRKLKAVKTVVYGEPANGHVSFSIEMFFDDALMWKPILERALAAVRQASDDYYRDC